MSREGVSWYRRAGVWMGIGTSPGVLAAGGGLAAQLSLPTLLVAIPIGGLAVTALAVGQAILSRRYWNLFVWMTTLSALAAALVALRYAGGSPAPPAATGDWNLADVLARTRSAGLGKLFLVVSVVAPVLSGLHSGTMALAAWPACRAGKRPCS